MHASSTPNVSPAPVGAFVTPCCPVCGASANAVLETLLCATPIDVHSNGEWGRARGRLNEVLWSSSEPIVKDGLYILRCPAKHEWSSVRGQSEARTSRKLVVWEIDYEGDPDDTPEAIAEWALAMQRNPQSIATVFTVVDRADGSRTAVDLAPEES